MKFKKTILTSAAAIFFATGVSAANADEKKFTDVLENDWYYSSVHKLVKFNLLGGFSDNTFKPKENVTRAQAASIIAKTLGLDLKNVKDPEFKDVSTNNTHYASIAKLTEMGIFTKGEKFNPNEPLTRAQMAKILVATFDLDEAQLKTFNDVKESDWYYEYAGILGTLGITTNAGEFKPNDKVARANLAAFIERVINHKRGNGKQDIWDSWKGWDDQNDGVNESEKPDDNSQAEETPKDNHEDKDADDKAIEELKKALNDAMDNLDDGIKDVEDVLEDLEEAIDENDKDEIEEQEDKLLEELGALDVLIKDAKTKLDKARKANYDDLETSEKSVEIKINKAQKLLDKTYANSFDKEYYLEEFDDAIEELEDAIEEGEKAIKDTSMTRLEKAKKALEEAIEDAEKILDSYNDSNVDVLKTEEKELKDKIKDAEDALDDVEDVIEGKADVRIDYLKDMIKSLDRAINDLEGADESKEIRDARNKLDDLVEDAEDLLDNSRDANLSSLKETEDKLADKIKEAKQAIENSRK